MTKETDTPNLPVKPPLHKKLQEKFELILDESYSVMPIGVMVEHARILDIAFRRSLYRAMNSGYPQDLTAALKAQNQYRLTVKALESYDTPKDGRIKT